MAKTYTGHSLISANSDLDALWAQTAQQWGPSQNVGGFVGLAYTYKGGTALDAAGATVQVAAGSIAMTNNAVNFVERTYAGVVSVNLAGFSTKQKIPMAKVTTAAGLITAVEDWRPTLGPFPYYPTGVAEVGVVDVRYALGDVRRYGAVPDGATDARAAFVAADTAVGAAAEIHIAGGTYAIATALSLTNAVRVAAGGRIKPANGVTVTLNGPLVGGLLRIFDISAGGLIAFGSGSIEVLRPEWWGVDGVDDEPAISAALTAGSLMSIPNEVRLLTNKTYRIGKPTRQRGSLTKYSGGGKSNTVVTPAYSHGIQHIVCPAVYPAFRTGASLLTGTGLSHPLANNHWLNLRDCQLLDLNGLAAFTAELTCKFTSAPAADSAILASNGRRDDKTTYDTCFKLGTNGGPLTAYITVAGVTYALASAVVPVNGGQYHLALTFDGANARFFVNGVLAATQAAVGTLTQAINEDVTLGPTIDRWPDGAILNGAAPVSVDSVRVSQTARYVAGFSAPTAKFVSDANTLMLLNFDSQYDMFTVGNTKTGNAHLFTREDSLVGVGNSSNCAVSDIWFKSNGAQAGVVFTYFIGGDVDRIRVDSTVWGILFWNNCYETRITRPHVVAGGAARFCIANVVQGGIFCLDAPLLIGSAYQLIVYSGSIRSDNAWHQGESNTHCFMLLYGDPTMDVVLTQPILACESGTPLLEAGIILSGMGSFTVVGGHLEQSGAVPVVIIHGGDRYTFVGSDFALGGVPAAIFSSPVTAPSSPVHVVNPRRSNAAVPWSSGSCPVLDDESLRLQGGTPNSAPVDADLSKSQVSFYLDEATGKLKARAKYADGATLKTGITVLNPVAAIVAPTAPSAAYVQAEATSMKTAVDAIRAALVNAGLTL
jgi:hypothetical protein